MIAATREQILVAALGCLGRYGFRRTSVDTIAKAAGVSRPTVYQYFPGKNQLLRAAGSHVLDAALAEASAIAESDAPLTERLHGALNAKLGLVVGHSDHEFRAEMMAETAIVAGDLVMSFRQRLTGIVADVLADDRGELDLAAADLTATDAARLLFDATTGIEQGDSPAPEARRRLRRLVEVTVRGLRRRPSG